ncbi:uncharacterized protein BKA78DRAFT_358564 [Phyllosticta capitalensis]|uniref:uncharacterized protein n=1 Tax=Phyllosticta capitalensis TaxID=121624 RepID=UPI003130DF0A
MNKKEQLVELRDLHPWGGSSANISYLRFCSHSPLRDPRHSECHANGELRGELLKERRLDAMRVFASSPPALPVAGQSIGPSEGGYFHYLLHDGKGRGRHWITFFQYPQTNGPMLGTCLEYRFRVCFIAEFFFSAILGAWQSEVVKKGKQDLKELRGLYPWSWHNLEAASYRGCCSHSPLKDTRFAGGNGNRQVDRTDDEETLRKKRVAAMEEYKSSPPALPVAGQSLVPSEGGGFIEYGPLLEVRDQEEIRVERNERQRLYDEAKREEARQDPEAHEELQAKNREKMKRHRAGKEPISEDARQARNLDARERDAQQRAERKADPAKMAAYQQEQEEANIRTTLRKMGYTIRRKRPGRPGEMPAGWAPGDTIKTFTRRVRPPPETGSAHNGRGPRGTEHERPRERLICQAASPISGLR